MRSANFINGDSMPLLGLGTWKSAPGEVGAALDQHLRLVDGSFWLLEGSPWSLQTLWDET